MHGHATLRPFDSLGCAAVFLIGGLTRDVKPTAILLRSGDTVIMSGPACRRAYHGEYLSTKYPSHHGCGFTNAMVAGVPRILEGTLPSHLEDDATSDWAAYEEYLRNARINVNVRQVFPRGFDPTRAGCVG